MNAVIVNRFSCRLFTRSIPKRNISILKTLDKNPVLVSANKDVFTNLALEHWLYTNLRFQDEPKNEEIPGTIFRKPVVLIWTDEPSVVIGRHQNAWVESTLGFLNKAGIKLARRHSGGGCVYHDENNINISIIGDRRSFENRQENLKFIARVLQDKYGIKCEPTKRHDLIHSESGLKLSGSAAKLGKFNCYHHFTILVDTNKDALYTAIRKEQQNFIKTNSTQSTRSEVINLKDIKGDLEVDQVISDLADSYCRYYNQKQALNLQAREERQLDNSVDYDGLNKIREELQSWDWVYGKTPSFSLEKCLTLIDGGLEKKVNFVIKVNKGLFEKIDIDTQLAGSNPSNSFKYLIGTKFTYKDAVVNVSKLLNIDESVLFSGSSSIGTQTLFATFLLQMIHESNF